MRDKAFGMVVSAVPLSERRGGAALADLIYPAPPPGFELRPICLGVVLFLSGFARETFGGRLPLRMRVEYGPSPADRWLNVHLGYQRG